MKIFKIENMSRGWFIGDFDPSVLKTDLFEVAVKRYLAGQYEELHHHRIAKEITVIVRGEVMILGKRYCTGDIVEVEPNEAIDFRAVTDVDTIVVKLPSVVGDKFLGARQC